MKRYIFTAFAAVIAITSRAYPYPSETDADADSSLWLDDVTVTAIKQKPDLSMQPGAVTTVNSGQVSRWSINSMKNVSEIAPNFYIPDYGSRMTSSIYVRGIGARMEQPVVGLSVDNVPMMNKDAYDFDVIDIDRIEVLRGPQSTLYGRNTMGGQINIYTLQPMKYQGCRVSGMFANGPEMRIGLSHYRRLAPALAMGFSGSFNYSDGFYRNQYNGRKVDTEKNMNLRWKTQWQASHSVSVDNVAAFNLSRQNGYPYEYAGSGAINYNDTCFYRRNAVSDGLTVKWIGSSFTVSSITSFQYLDDNMTLDQDFQPVSYFTLTQARRELSLTQDVVIRGTGHRYSWMAGLFGFYKHASMDAPVTLKEDGIARLITDRINNNDRIPILLQFDRSEILLGSDFKIPVWGLALYHQSTLDLGRWNFALGLRLDYESTTLRYHSLCNTSFSVFNKTGIPPVALMNPKINIADHGKLQDQFLEFLPKLTVSYDLPMRSPSCLYASVGKGYKSGGYNTQMFSEVLQQRMMAEMMKNVPASSGQPAGDPDVDAIVSYRPEKCWNYEVGAHIGCADGRVMTDLAVFYIDCRDQQLTMFPDESTTGRITTNAGKTRSYGAEVQIRFNPTDRWAFNFSYGYTNAKFVQFVDGGVDYKGRYVPYAPVNTLFASASYTHSVCPDVHLGYNLNCRGIGRVYWNESNSVVQPLYALLGASVTVSWRNRLEIEGWMENMTGTGYDTFYFSSLGNSFLQRGKPRRFGVTVRLNFEVGK